jgi:hypothetical protein
VNIMKLLFIALFSIVSLAAFAESSKKTATYLAPNGSVRVSVVPAGKETGRADYESRIVFRAADNNLLCTLDFSSEDAEHGYGLVKAEWTPDSQYFVFSLASSGGHQAWHASTEFYSQRDGTVRSLDDYSKSEITKAAFQTVAPNTVKTERAGDGDKTLPVSIKLDALPALRSWRRKKSLLTPL